MSFEEVAANALPLILAVIALGFALQGWLRRDRVKLEPPLEPSASGLNQPSSGVAVAVDAPPIVMEDKVGPSAMFPPLQDSPAPATAQNVFDFTATVDDLDYDDDDLQYTLIDNVSDEMREKITGHVAGPPDGHRGEPVVPEFDVDLDFEVVAEQSFDADFRLSTAGLTDCGVRRKVNEDSLLLMADVPMFLVVDGMGGYAGGEVASALAVESVEQAFRTGTFDGEVNEAWPILGDELARSFHMAHEAVLRRSAAEPRLQDMGTTAVAIRFSKNAQTAYVANVGDSRCYRIRGGELTQLTKDHTLATLLGVKGKAGRKLTQAIGVHETVAVDISVEPVQPQDIFLLCSDGLTKMVAEEGILQLALSSPDLHQATQNLINAANANGGRDNVTVILARVDDPGFMA